jgi:hypothetical protein
MEACGAMRGALKPWPTQRREGSQGATHHDSADAEEDQ